MLPLFAKDQSFNDTFTNDIFSFEQLGPGIQLSFCDIIHMIPEDNPQLFKINRLTLI